MIAVDADRLRGLDADADLVAGGRGHQLINEASDAPVRAPLNLDPSADQPA